MDKGLSVSEIGKEEGCGTLGGRPEHPRDFSGDFLLSH